MRFFPLKTRLNRGSERSEGYVHCAPMAANVRQLGLQLFSCTAKIDQSATGAIWNKGRREQE